MTRKQVVLVTGVSSGIGRATARLLARGGLQVFGSMREAGEVTPGVEGVRLDVRDEASSATPVRSRPLFDRGLREQFGLTAF